MTDYPVELQAPDIAPYAAGNTGVPYVTRFDGSAPGPVAMVNALTHGNELCGAIAVDFLFRNRVRPAKGSLILSFANVAAYQRFDRAAPDISRFVDEDFNRLWDPATLDGPRQSVELARARQMRPIVDQVDMLLDLHSMQHATPPLALAGLAEKGTALARAVGIPELIVVDQGHSAGRRLRDYGAFGAPEGERSALLIECGQHWERSSAAIAIQSTLRFLALFDMVDPALCRRHLPVDPPPAQRVIRVTDAVTVTSERFQFADEYLGMEVIPRAGTVIAQDGDQPIATPYDDCVLIMPSRRLTRGQTAVRLGRFIG